MVATSLQDDLLSIPGVEGAEIDGSHDSPAGLRIRIAEGADQEAVGGAIRRVLSSHGLGTDTQLPGEAAPRDVQDSQPETQQDTEPRAVAVLTSDDVELTAVRDIEEVAEVPETQRGPVIDLTDKAPEVTVSAEVADDDTDVDVSERLSSVVEPGSWEKVDPPPFVEPRARAIVEPPAKEAPKDEAAAHHGPDLSDSIARIDSVAVIESRTGIVVTVTASNGDEVSHVAASSEGGVEAAVIIAASKLVDRESPDPMVIEIEDRRVEGVDIVMIVLDMDGRIVAGSAIVEAGRAFALGRATWASLAV